MDIESLLAKALKANKESRSIEFKESLDVSSQRDWCEIIKDIIAIANTDGGVILVGVNNMGRSVRSNLRPVLGIDHADLVSKIHKYTNTHFSDIEITEQRKEGRRIAALRIQRTQIPIVFTKPGTYDIGGGRQGRAFSEGTVYFRHGAKSEPGTSEDLRKSMEKQFAVLRKQLLTGVRKVVSAPTNSRIIVLPDEVMASEVDAAPIRIVDDPSAPAFRKIDPAKTHPYLIDKIAAEIKQFLGLAKFGRYEIQAIRHLENLSETTRPDLIYPDKVHNSSPQYSPAFLDLIRKKLKRPSYLTDAVDNYKKYMRQRSQNKTKPSS
jgi:hypothetical protein